MSDPGNRCRGLTKQGKQCTRSAQTDRLCWQHARQERIAQATAGLDSEGASEQTGFSRTAFLASAALLIAVVVGLTLYDAEQILATWIARLVMPPLAIISIAALLDSLTKRQLKKVIAGFFIGLSEVSFKQYEMAVISAIVNLFTNRDGKVSFARVLAYSFIGSIFITTCLVAVRNYSDLFGTAANTDAPFTLILFSILLLSILTANLSVASDYLSISVTKFLFLKRRWHPLLIPLVLVLDAVVSGLIAVMPLGVTVGLAYVIAGKMFTEAQTAAVLSPILLATGTTLSLSTFITVLQAFILLSGVLFRFVGGTLLAHVKILNVEDYPLTVLMIWAFVIAIPGRVLFLWIRFGSPWG